MLAVYDRVCACLCCRNKKASIKGRQRKKKNKATKTTKKATARAKTSPLGGDDGDNESANAELALDDSLVGDDELGLALKVSKTDEEGPGAQGQAGSCMGVCGSQRERRARSVSGVFVSP